MKKNIIHVAFGNFLKTIMEESPRLWCMIQSAEIHFLNENLISIAFDNELQLDHFIKSEETIIDFIKEETGIHVLFLKYPSKKENYNLFYSEETGLFYQESFHNNFPNFLEHDMICKNAPISQCDEFIKNMVEKYPNINTEKKPVPRFFVIKKEFKEFLLS